MSEQKRAVVELLERLKTLEEVVEEEIFTIVEKMPEIMPAEVVA